MEFNTIFDNLIKDTMAFINENKNIDQKLLSTFLNKYRILLKNANKGNNSKTKKCKLCKIEFEANKNQKYCCNCNASLYFHAENEGIHVNSYIKKLKRKGIL